MAGKWTAQDIPDQHGRTAVVTGANSGLGLATARELARGGAHVVLACRSEQRGAAALAQLREAVPDADVELAPLDLGDLASVRAFAEWFASEHDGLDVLVNNAGIMAVPKATTADGFESQIGTNHLGHFALTGLLLPSLLARPQARVVTVSSVAHRMGSIKLDDLNSERRYQRWLAYGQSKLANLVFTFELQRPRRRRRAGPERDRGASRLLLHEPADGGQVRAAGPPLCADRQPAPRPERRPGRLAEPVRRHDARRARRRVHRP